MAKGGPRQCEWLEGVDVVKSNGLGEEFPGLTVLQAGTQVKVCMAGGEECFIPSESQRETFCDHARDGRRKKCPVREANPPTGEEVAREDVRSAFNRIALEVYGRNADEEMKVFLEEYVIRIYFMRYLQDPVPAYGLRDEFLIQYYRFAVQHLPADSVGIGALPAGFPREQEYRRPTVRMLKVLEMYLLEKGLISSTYYCAE